MSATEVPDILKALTAGIAYFARQAHVDPRQIMQQTQLVLEDALKISDAEVKGMTEAAWRRVRQISK